MTIITIVQIILGIALTISILLQNQTGGLGSSFGGSATYHTKRGVEKGLFYVTVVLGILFTLVSVIALM